MGRDKNRKNTQDPLVLRTPFRVPVTSRNENFENPRCYARCLQNCSKKISKEHYFSYSLLNKIASKDHVIHLKGAPWNPSGVWLRPETLTASILCQRHNQQLGPLDAFASALDDELIRIYSSTSKGPIEQTITRFHGPNLERWLMKTLCGFAVARPGIFSKDKETAIVPEEWVRYLFGEIELPRPAGLYISPTPGESRTVNPSGFTFTSLYAQGVLSGIMVDMRILRLKFISIPWKGTIRGIIKDTSIWRPWRINIDSNGTKWCLDFDWPEESGPEALFRLVFGKDAT